MNILIPVAGVTKKLRMHKFSTAKPSIPFASKSIGFWLDIGSQRATSGLNKPFSNFMENRDLLGRSAKSTQIVFRDPNLSNKVMFNNVLIGSHVRISDNSKMLESKTQKESQVKNANLANSMPANFVTFEGQATNLSIGVVHTVSQF